MGFKFIFIINTLSRQMPNQTITKKAKIYFTDFSGLFFFGTERGSGQKQNAGQRERKPRRSWLRRSSGSRSQKAAKDKQKLWVGNKPNFWCFSMSARAWFRSVFLHIFHYVSVWCAFLPNTNLLVYF